MAAPANAAVDQLSSDFANASLNGADKNAGALNTNVAGFPGDELDPTGQTPSSAAPHPQASASLYVGELDTSVTEAMLFELFSQIADSSRILTNIGLIYATLGEHEAAVEQFTAATELDQYLAVA